MPKWLQNHPKINLLALGGLIFEILGGFWRRQIFDELLSRGDTAAPHWFLATEGKAVESEKLAETSDAGVQIFEFVAPWVDLVS